MKTTTIKNESRTLEDLIFENRNKAYGAYALNRHCMKYLFIAFLISLAGVSTSVAVPFLKMMKHGDSYRLPDHKIKVNIADINDETVLPPPPPPPLPEKALRDSRYITPVIVEEAPDGPGIEIMKELVEKPNNPVIPDEIPFVGNSSKEIGEPVEEPLLNPQEHASFMNGDLKEFSNWVQKNIKYPEKAIEHDIFGKVIVEFCINSLGQVVDVKIMRGVDSSLDQETMRVLLSSPLWKAARQGGVPVKQRFTMPVIFQLN